MPRATRAHSRKLLQQQLDLNDDVLVLVVDFAEDQRELSKVQRVKELLRLRLVSEKWRLAVSRSKALAVEELDLGIEDQRTPLSFYRHFANLTSLKMWTTCSVAEIVDVLTACPRLTELQNISLTQGGALDRQKDCSVLEQLRSLSLANCGTVPGHAADLLRACRNLEHLDLWNVRPSGISVGQMVECVEAKLQSLRVGGDDSSLGDNDVSSICRAQPSLTSLKVRNAVAEVAITEVALEAMHGLRSLEELDLSFSMNYLSATALHAVVQACPKLKELIIVRGADYDYDPEEFPIDAHPGFPALRAIDALLQGRGGGLCDSEW